MSRDVNAGTTYVERDVNAGRNFVGRDALEASSIIVNTNGNTDRATDHELNLDAFRIALFGDSKLNFRGLIVRLDEVEIQLRKEIADLKHTINLLERQVNELKRNVTVRQTHLIISIFNLIFVVALFVEWYLFSH